MIKVSIIVPVYNVELYLDKCLNSLVNQTLKEIEIIVVNDGSKDNSQAIIDKYANKYNNIKALRKENGGLSDARNYGIKYASGEYIGYVDSDDYVTLDMYEKLYNKAIEEKSDIVECNLYHDYNNHQDIEIGTKIYDKKKLLILGRSVVWNKIYNREWLLSTKVEFSKGLIYEDVEFYSKLLLSLRKISYIDDACIYYVQRESSVNYNATLKTMDILKILKNIICYYKENGAYEEYKDELEFLTTRIILCSSFLRMCRIKDKNDRKKATQESLEFLYDNFPNWKNNVNLKEYNSPKKVFMMTINKTTYKFYTMIFSKVYLLKEKIYRLHK